MKTSNPTISNTVKLLDKVWAMHNNIPTQMLVISINKSFNMCTQTTKHSIKVMPCVNVKQIIEKTNEQIGNNPEEFPNKSIINYSALTSMHTINKIKLQQPGYKAKTISNLYNSKYELMHALFEDKNEDEDKDEDKDENNLTITIDMPNVPNVPNTNPPLDPIPETSEKDQQEFHEAMRAAAAQALVENLSNETFIESNKEGKS
jgi:hypothetical protein